MAGRVPRKDDAVYIISVFADLAGIHPQTLRMYERKGLLDPQRTSGNSRRYSARDLGRLARIQDLTQAGVNLAGVRIIMDLERKLEDARARLNNASSRIAEIEAQLARSQRVSTRGVLVRLSDVRSVFEDRVKRG